MNIDTLNAHGGFGFNPEPRPSEGRRTINVVGARSVFVLRRPGPFRGRRRSPACCVVSPALGVTQTGRPVVRPRGLKCMPRPLAPTKNRRVVRLRRRGVPISPQRLLPPTRQDSARARANGPARTEIVPSTGRCGFRFFGQALSRCWWRLVIGSPPTYEKIVLLSFPTSDRTRLPAEFKHITKRRKRN